MFKTIGKAFSSISKFVGKVTGYKESNNMQETISTPAQFDHKYSNGPVPREKQSPKVRGIIKANRELRRFIVRLGAFKRLSDCPNELHPNMYDFFNGLKNAQMKLSTKRAITEQMFAQR
jgi:hypothetical protein